MSIAAVSPALADPVMAEAVMAKPFEVSFEAAISRMTRDVRIESAAFGQRIDMFGVARPMLDGLVAEQRRFELKSAALDSPSRAAPAVGAGGAAQAFGGDPNLAPLDRVMSAMSNMTEIAGFVAKIQIVHKGMQGFQRVWDTLSKGQ